MPCTELSFARNERGFGGRIDVDTQDGKTSQPCALLRTDGHGRVRVRLQGRVATGRGEWLVTM